MRIHKWMFLNDDEGKPVPGADVSIFLAGSNIDAAIYLNEFSDDVVTSSPHLRTNDIGYFEFWIGDEYEINGYNSRQKFKILWEKIGIIDGFVDYIDVFPGFIEVDEFDVDPTKNKTVSNRMAFLWEQHRLSKNHIIHGIEEVDEKSDNPKKNKLVSDKIIKKFDETLNFDFNTEYDENLAPLGLRKVDPKSKDNIFNKLMSNEFAYFWQEHIEKILKAGVDTDICSPHGLQLVDPQKTDDVFNKLVSNQFIRNIYLALNKTLFIKEYSIYADDWSFDRVSGYYRVLIYHNLNTITPFVECYYKNKKILPYDINVVDNNTIEMIMPLKVDINIIVSGKGNSLKV